MNLQELIKTNTENREKLIESFDDWTETDSGDVYTPRIDIDKIKSLEDKSIDLILNNILEYIEGKKKDLGKFGSYVAVEINAHNKALQLIADYIKGDNK